MNAIRKAWEIYRTRVMPSDPSPIQLLETERAFYAGAGSFAAIANAIADPKISEDKGVEILESAHQEIRTFAEEDHRRQVARN